MTLTFPEQHRFRAHLSGLVSSTRFFVLQRVHCVVYDSAYTDIKAVASLKVKKKRCVTEFEPIRRDGVNGAFFFFFRDIPCYPLFNPLPPFPSTLFSPFSCLLPFLSDFTVWGTPCCHGARAHAARVLCSAARPRRSRHAGAGCGLRCTLAAGQRRLASALFGHTDGRHVHARLRLGICHRGRGRARLRCCRPLGRRLHKQRILLLQQCVLNRAGRTGVRKEGNGARRGESGDDSVACER